MRRSVLSPLSVPGLIITALLLPRAQAEVVLSDVAGTVEQQRGTWQLAHTGDSVSQGLRTGTGRAAFKSGTDSQVLLGSSTELGFYQNEPNLLSGHFYITGNGGFFVQGVHYFSSGKVRIDLQDNVQRIAVITGSLRIAIGTQVSTIKGGQQYDLKAQKILSFTEGDPWYMAGFMGAGVAQIEATNGKVTLKNNNGNSTQTVQPIKNLEPGQVLTTSEQSWAEISFTGGGYLRLQPQSALSVQSIEKTTKGREVQLKLLRGSAWNVVAKGQGGYQITTPTVTTAVRGTTFRVDATGAVKLFEGKVVLPSNGDLAIAKGQQVDPSGTVQTLQLDQTDLQNQALDQEHDAPLQLQMVLKAVQQRLDLILQSQPSTQIAVTLTPQGGSSLPAEKLSASPAAQANMGQGVTPLSTFALQNPKLPEGRYTVQVLAERFGQHKTLTGSVLIDRTAPTLSHIQVQRVGHILHLQAQVQDQSAVLLKATLGHQSYTQWVKARADGTDGTALNWNLPLAQPDEPLSLQAVDRAGNAITLSHADLQGTQSRP